MKDLRILFVDDEPNILQAFQRQLRNTYKLEVNSSPKQAIDSLSKSNAPAVVISDMRMPEMNGIEFLKEIQKNAPDTVRIMLTGNADRDTAVRAVNESNIFRFLCKPCSADDLAKAIEDGLKQYQLIVSEKELLNNTLSGSVKLLTDILSLVNPEALGSVVDTRPLIRKLCEEAGATQTWDIELAAMLVDLGILVVPEDVASKVKLRQELSAKESALIEQVPQIGFNLVTNIPRLQGVANLILHAKSSYTNALAAGSKIAGQQLPLGSRIIKVVLDFKKLEVSTQSTQTAFEQILAQSQQYDPSLLKLLAKLLSSQGNKAETETKPEPMQIGVNDLCVGQVLLEDVKTSSGKLLIAKGNIITQSMVEKIKGYESTIGVIQPIFVNHRIPTI